MRKLVAFLTTFLFCFSSFSQEEKTPDIYITLGNCSSTFTPLVLGEYQQVQQSPNKRIFCDKYDSIFMCNIIDNEENNSKLFFLKKNPDHSFSQIGDSKDKEYLLINDRAVFYKRMEIMKLSVYNEVCQGTYTTLEQKNSRKLINLNLGLKSIFKSLGSKNE